MSSMTKFLSQFFASIPPDIVLSTIGIGLLIILVYGTRKLLIVIKFTGQLKNSIKSLSINDNIDFPELKTNMPRIADLLSE